MKFFGMPQRQMERKQYQNICEDERNSEMKQIETYIINRKTSKNSLKLNMLKYVLKVIKNLIKKIKFKLSLLYL